MKGLHRMFNTIINVPDPVAEVDEVLMRAITSGDPLIAANYGLSLKRTVALKGVALAKLLYGLRENWETFQSAQIEDSFEDFVQAHMGIDPQTTRKYSDMWEHIFASPYIEESLKLLLQGKPIKELLLLTAAAEEGSLTEEEWQTVVVADHSTIRSMIKQARGRQAAHANAVYIAIYMQDGKYPKGTIVASNEEGEEDIGFLYLDKAEGATYVSRAINRIMRSPGMLERR